MKALPLTLHLLNKDLRHQRVWLALLWVLALLLPVTARLVNGTGDSVMLLAVAGFFLLGLV
ncbi:MAG TPA: hypothetical protein VG733_07830, partial [Chthoniobacteraceae bacterium]|nr:hypothetical protein [Chthoniobacteraceae bacterium]